MKMGVVKKSLVLGIIMLFMGTTISYADLLDQLDQSQTEYNTYYELLDGSAQAQSFKPTFGKLTKIELLMSRSSEDASTFVVKICKKLKPFFTVLISKTVQGFMLPIYPNKAWIEVDFEDIELYINQIYYIVINDFGNIDDYNMWWVSFQNPYSRGERWFNPTYPEDIQNWNKIDSQDFCFKTYGQSISNRAPDMPIVDGPNHCQPGEILNYQIMALDKDDDDVRYIINWDDGDEEETSWYFSGSTISRSHIYNQIGQYNMFIEAVDKWGVVGPRFYMNIICPRPDQGVISGTQITMAPGSSENTKPIESLQEGEKIASYNPITQEITIAEVVEVLEYTENIPERFLFNDILDITTEQTLYINGNGWIEAKDTQISYNMIQNQIEDTPNITSVPIVKKEPLTEPVDSVYDLIIQPISGEACGYWANGILVGGYN
jgi:hypothetical protein